MQRELRIPIGLVNACRGGSRIESWVRVPPKNLPEEGGGNRGVSHGGLYRDRIVSLPGYGMQGALWYQGEANAKEGESYFLKMEAMIHDGRTSWKLGNFPFYFVQLAGIGTSPADKPEMGDGRARIREVQRRALTIENTGMAVSIDIGAKGEHPPNKVEVGERLAHWALHHDGPRDTRKPGKLNREPDTYHWRRSGRFGNRFFFSLERPLQTNASVKKIDQLVVARRCPVPIKRPALCRVRGH